MSYLVGTQSKALGAAIVETAFSAFFFVLLLGGIIQAGLYAHYALKFNAEFKRTLLKIAANQFDSCARDPDEPESPDSDIWLNLLAAEFSGDCPICKRLGVEAESGPRIVTKFIRNWPTLGTSPSGPMHETLMQSLGASAEWRLPSLWGGGLKISTEDEVVIQADFEQVQRICP